MAWWAGLDSLGVKLFAAIASVNLVVVVLAWLVHGWSFDQGLAAYLKRADQARLAPLVERLAQEHAQRGSWQWLADDHDAWHGLLREELGLVISGDGPPAGRRPERAAAFADGRLMLLDARRVPVIGPADRVEGALLFPIESQGPSPGPSQGEVLGFLARSARPELLASLEGAVSAQQGRQFAVMALGLLAAVLLAAALIARWLSGRLARLGAGAAAVALGDYAVRLPDDGSDELARLSGDFNRMAQALQAAQQARQRWIADIAHELRTPLAGLQAEIEALQDGVRQPTADRLASLAQQVQRLTRLVGDLRLLSLSDLGALDQHPEPLDLGDLVADFLQHPPVPTTGLQLRLQLPTGLRVRADAARLEQVLGNLLQNTLHHCDAPAVLQVSLRREGHRAVLRWEDSSPGVPADELPRLTERLYRGDRSRARASGGSGLGLAIVRALVEGHGGGLQASASALGGLAWDIWLPLLPEQVPHG